MNFSPVISQFYQSLLSNCGYVVLIANFIINIKQLKALKDIGIGICDIAKVYLGFLVELLQIQKPLRKKKNREMRIYTTAISDIQSFI